MEVFGILEVVVLVLVGVVVAVAVVVIAVDRLAAFIFPHFSIINGRETNPTHRTKIIKTTAAKATECTAENKKILFLFQVA